MNLFEKNIPFVGAVISGKGGVGKSMTTVNTAAMLNDMGYRVAIIDADLGLANCATMFNEPVKSTVCEWIKGEISLESISQHCGGITLVTGADSPDEMTMAADVIMDALDQTIEFLKITHDYILIDTPAGAGEMTLWALDAAELGILVLVDEPSAISDLYRLCKYVYSIDPAFQFASIVNFADDENSAKSTITRFNTILGNFLDKESPYLGFIPEHKQIRTAVQKQATILSLHGSDTIVGELEFIAQNLVSHSNVLEQNTVKIAVH
jgi:flagellar biosynthesis protein FlhG